MNNGIQNEHYGGEHYSEGSAGYYDNDYDHGEAQERVVIPNDPAYRRRFLECINEYTVSRKRAHPILIFTLLLVFFPAGLGLMYFGTRWGVFVKVVITVFTLAAALAVYEALVAFSVLTTPSLVGTVVYIFSQL